MEYLWNSLPRARVSGLVDHGSVSTRDYTRTDTRLAYIQGPKNQKGRTVVTGMMHFGSVQYLGTRAQTAEVKGILKHCCNAEPYGVSLCLATTAQTAD